MTHRTAPAYPDVLAGMTAVNTPTHPVGAERTAAA